MAAYRPVGAAAMIVLGFRVFTIVAKRPDLYCVAAVLLLAALAVAWTTWQERVLAPKLGGRKVIFLGPACGHAGYTMGFVSALLEEPEIRERLLRKEVLFGGVSSGAQAAAYAMASLHGVMSMKEWYQRDLRRGYEILKEKWPFVMGQEVEKAVHRYYSDCKEKLGGVPPWLHNFPISVTESFSILRPRFITSMPSAEETAAAMKGSCFVPGFMGFEPWVQVDSCRAFDGFLGLFRATFPDNYMYISFLPTAPRSIVPGGELLRVPRHFLAAHRYDTTKDHYLVKAWPWGDPEWADAAFERGRRDSVVADVRAKLVAFLDE
eukprot:gnl/TRDRNA2_/TRDRNA2_134089_c0_seq1.p1 gnl/TRDRNA2_/TRDRNA2_134089_c0~~gnl/TRDRNA2_/TRDRNA2_134089_c0_seq1.p1  ORF type:complete len:337 (+),score=60.99 gnl/TRDRNA2_/TRDRNA2_134089_c0_seq1:51-1013(+)